MNPISLHTPKFQLPLDYGGFSEERLKEFNVFEKVENYKQYSFKFAEDKVNFAAPPVEKPKEKVEEKPKKKNEKKKVEAEVKNLKILGEFLEASTISSNK